MSFWACHVTQTSLGEDISHVSARGCFGLDLMRDIFPSTGLCDTTEPSSQSQTLEYKITLCLYTHKLFDYYAMYGELKSCNSHLDPLPQTPRLSVEHHGLGFCRWQLACWLTNGEDHTCLQIQIFPSFSILSIRNLFWVNHACIVTDSSRCLNAWGISADMVVGVCIQFPRTGSHVSYSHL